ncbi:hypothetical protein [Bythopirellula polymerisocia]|uniref:Uncharacterized protein n=1 Tax=Bythopirellula polymerisocia TaxID=2528003 RepID=A0A5C6CSP3_9BACT|nr:hypothetical protein [Bythopirellula polymerisocia]TWU25789.1 hypothetical protein Pla144_30010 [Bythopirellula polymerisocia]
MNIQSPPAHPSYSQPSSNGDSSAVTPDVVSGEQCVQEFRCLEDFQWRWNEDLKWTRTNRPDHLLPMQYMYVEQLEIYSDKFKEEAQGDDPACSTAEPRIELDLAMEAIAQLRARLARKKNLAKFLDPVDRQANDPARNGHPPSAASAVDVDENAPESDEQFLPTDGDSDLEPDSLGPAPSLPDDEPLAEASASEQGCRAASQSSCDSSLEDDLPQEPILEKSVDQVETFPHRVPQSGPFRDDLSVAENVKSVEKPNVHKDAIKFEASSSPEINPQVPGMTDAGDPPNFAEQDLDTSVDSEQILTADTNQPFDPEQIADEYVASFRSVLDPTIAEKTKELETEIKALVERENYIEKCSAVTLQEAVLHMEWKPPGVIVSALPGSLQISLLEMKQLAEEVYANSQGSLERSLGMTVLHLSWLEIVEMYYLNQAINLNDLTKEPSKPQHRKKLDRYLTVVHSKLAATGILAKVQELRDKQKTALRAMGY